MTKTPILSGPFNSQQFVVFVASYPRNRSRIWQVPPIQVPEAAVSCWLWRGEWAGGVSEALRSASKACSRRRSDRETVIEIPLRMPHSHALAPKGNPKRIQNIRFYPLGGGGRYQNEMSINPMQTPTMRLAANSNQSAPVLPCGSPAVNCYQVWGMRGAGGGAPEGKRNGNFRHGGRTKDANDASRYVNELVRLVRGTD